MLVHHLLPQRLLIILILLFEGLVVKVLNLFEGIINIVFHVGGSNAPERNLGEVALHDISQMDIVARLHLPIDRFCRIEHIEAEITASQHL